MDRIYRIGQTVEISCSFDLGKLTSLFEFDKPQTANLFYDIFLEDYNGDLIDVPLLIKNLEKGGKKLNRNRGGDNIIKDDWVLTRRFFMFETISGILYEP